mgnify:FL=1
MFTCMRGRLVGMILAAFTLTATALAGPADQPSPAAPAIETPTPRPYPERLRWWAEARFGIFVH